MASSSESMQSASDEVIDIVCGPCMSVGDAKEAKKYCNDCIECLCDPCLNHHAKLSLTKNHKITSVQKLYSGAFQHREVNVRMTLDREDPFISGCAVMTNGYVVICDTNNKKIKLLDASLELNDSLYLPTPWDVSVLDDSTVIVTLSYYNRLQMIQIFPRMKTGRVLEQDKKCWGVAVSGDNIYVSCHNNPGDGEVRVLDKKGNIKRRLGVFTSGAFLFLGPSYITVSRPGDKIYVSDSDTDTVTCMKADGSIVYTTKGWKWLRGLYCTDNGSVLVCDRDSQNVHMIEAGGDKGGMFLTTNDGVKKPASVAFRKSDNLLVVTSQRQNCLFVCKLSVGL